jgi:Pyridoxamine 5'-phosphate oxidase
MVAWRDVADSAPEFAARVQQRFDVHKHKTMATLRKDGSPRISGIEVQFIAGELWFGSMAGAMKALDLRRDPRFALHGPSVDADENDPAAWGGDAKLSGLAIELTDQAEIEAAFRAMGAEPGQYDDSHVFKVDIHEVVLTRVGDPADHLVIELWRPDTGLRRFERK